uniref:NADH dehydrogenase subunit 4 n=1 Tax=Dixoniella grisea TaxID=35153 RepID=UPI001FCDEE65|nr:NADH dehydrogenase subunit 4 [Dixoniella grisea]UNJ18983.1 NADH dehydrogenase subunit 4 [Dixoniella grisea]
MYFICYKIVMITYIYLGLVLLPFFGAFCLTIINYKNFILQRFVAFFISCLTLIFSLLLWVFFDSSTAVFQFLFNLKWFSILNINYILGIDGISLFFIILTAFLIPLCLLVSWNYSSLYLKEYLISFLILEGFLFQVFSVLDIFLFYIYFESVLLPMFFIVGIWGSRERKIRAVYQLFLYTIVGSIIMLLAILTIYFETGTTNLQTLWNIEFSEFRQIFLWISFFLAFAVKIPMPPFHIWLPEAHSEAPTAGSVILAGILLKLGGYGFLRFSLTLLPLACNFFLPFIYLLSILAIIYASLSTLRQIDLKKAIAYSSIAHMGLVTLGLFSESSIGIEGGIHLMISHGLVSSALFLCIGIIYDRYKTRIIKYYGGLTQFMPLFSTFFLFFSFANVGFPCTISFISEFLIFLGIYLAQSTLAVFAGVGMLLSVAYSIWLFNRVCFGFLKNYYILKFQDLTRREFWLLFPIVIVVIWLGVYSNIIIGSIHFSVLNLLNFY